MQIKPVFKPGELYCRPKHIGVPPHKVKEAYAFPVSHTVHFYIVKDWMFTICEVCGMKLNKLFHPNFTSSLDKNTPGYHVVTDMLFKQGANPKGVAKHPVYGFWSNHSHNITNPWVNIFTYALAIVDDQDSHDAQIARYMLGTTFDSLKLVKDPTELVMEFDLSVPQLASPYKDPEYIHRIIPKHPTTQVIIDGRKIRAIIQGANSPLE